MQVACQQRNSLISLPIVLYVKRLGDAKCQYSRHFASHCDAYCHFNERLNRVEVGRAASAIRVTSTAVPLVPKV